MGDTEKIDILPGKDRSSVSRPETNVSADIFDQLQALINSSNFNLIGRINKSKDIDDKTKKEILGYIDEAQELVVAFRRGETDMKSAKEAADCFEVLEDMAARHLPGFDKQLEEYNKSIEAEKAALKEKRSDADLIAAESKKKDDSEPAKILSFIMPTKKDSMSFLPPKGKNQAEITIAGKSGESNEAKNDFKGVSSLYGRQARRFRDVREANNINTVKLEEGSDKNKEKNPGKKSGGKEPLGGEDVEKLKIRLDEAFKKLYGFLNEGKEAPKEVYDLLGQTETELLNKVKYRNEVTSLAEKIKEKYKKNERSKDKKNKKSLKPDQEKKVEAKKQKTEQLPLKAELPLEIRKIFLSAANDFSQQLKTEAEAMPRWHKYSDEAKKTLLRIDTETFLRDLIKNKLVARNLIDKEDVGKLVRDLMGENNK